MRPYYNDNKIKQIFFTATNLRGQQSEIPDQQMSFFGLEREL